MNFLPEARTRRIEHVSMRRLASIQSKYDGPNQNSICSVKNFLLPFLSDHFKRKETWSQPMETRCKKRSTETRQIQLYAGPMAERRSIPSVSIDTRLDLTSVSSTSTTSPRLTSVMMHLTDSDYGMKALSA